MTRSVLIFALMALMLMIVPTIALAREQKTKGARTKGWRRRAQDWGEAKVKSTIVTNPTTLGKGKGKGKEVTYTTWDEDGRTTFVIDCDQRTARKAGDSSDDKSSVKLGPKIGGKGKGGLPPLKGTDEEEAKTIPANICDDVGDGDDSGGGFDGGGNGGGGNGGDMDVGLGNGNTEYPPEGTGGGGQVEQASGGLYGCAEISAQNAPTTDSAESVSVTLEVIHAIQQNTVDGGSQTILTLMRADLQDAVAPVIADCITNNGGIKPSGSSDFGIFSGTAVEGMYGNETLVTNVEFQDLTGDNTGCSQSYQDEASNNSGICLLTTIPVVLYYEGDDTSNFEERVQTAIDGHSWDVPGLIMTSPVHKNSDNSVSAIETEEAQDSTAVGPAGYMMIAAAALLLLLLSLMLVRRKRRDEMVKHVSLEDDDDTYLRDLEGESDVSGAQRLANVVGEDGDSVNTGWTGASHFRNAAATDGYFSNSEDRPSHQDVHICSSATCEVCERNRQGGVQFIPSNTNLSHAPLPADAPREYSADDTVCL